MGFFNALRNACVSNIGAPYGGSFNRSGLNFNAAIKLIKGSSVAVEFHMNAAASKQANGVETIALPKDKKLAQDLSKAVADALGSRAESEAMFEKWLVKTELMMNIKDRDIF